MSKLISFPKAPVTQEPLPLLDIIEEVYTARADGTMLVINLRTLDKVLKGKMSPSVLDDEVLRLLLQGSMDSILKQVSLQLNNLF